VIYSHDITNQKGPAIFGKHKDRPISVRLPTANIITKVAFCEVLFSSLEVALPRTSQCIIGYTIGWDKYCHIGEERYSNNKAAPCPMITMNKRMQD
jgi:hypothetical protein